MIATSVVSLVLQSENKFFDSQVTKTLIYDLHETFCAVQELARTNNEILRPENAILISQHYRMAIRTALENVQDNDREKKELVLHRELYNADVLWSLTEAVYIQSTDNPLVIDLINWGLHCFGNAAKTICDQVVEKADAPETHQYYWNALVLSIVHADFTSAMRVLRKHSNFERDNSLQQLGTFLQSLQFAVDSGIENTSSFIDTQKVQW
ncbi:hypothetical protein M3Y96_01073300 [Aphelenchoides besseyi]|nr:hypothetical protein M3Y96_01073300 [Aphelenchoides besseyi]